MTTAPKPIEIVTPDARRHGQPVPTALFCGAAHVWDPATLCSRLAGHTGLHVAGDGDDWDPTEHDTEETR